MPRILGGKFRGRKLVTPAGRNTRPTSARVREAIFDILDHSPDVPVEWSGLCVLDLYAGSGAFGLEALSRGARWATLVEQDPAAVKAMQLNVQKMNLNSCCKVVQAAVSLALARMESGDRSYGLVFMDPPYGDEAQTRDALVRLDRFSGLAAGACVVLEKPGGSFDIADKWNHLNLVTRRQWGDTEVVFLRHV